MTRKPGDPSEDTPQEQLPGVEQTAPETIRHDAPLEALPIVTETPPENPKEVAKKILKLKKDVGATPQETVPSKKPSAKDKLTRREWLSAVTAIVGATGLGVKEALDLIPDDEHPEGKTVKTGNTVINVEFEGKPIEMEGQVIVLESDYLPARNDRNGIEKFRREIYKQHKTVIDEARSANIDKIYIVAEKEGNKDTWQIKRKRTAEVASGVVAAGIGIGMAGNEIKKLVDGKPKDDGVQRRGFLKTMAKWLAGGTAAYLGSPAVEHIVRDPKAGNPAADALHKFNYLTHPGLIPNETYQEESRHIVQQIGAIINLESAGPEKPLNITARIKPQHVALVAEKLENPEMVAPLQAVPQEQLPEAPKGRLGKIKAGAGKLAGKAKEKAGKAARDAIGLRENNPVIKDVVRLVLGQPGQPDSLPNIDFVDIQNAGQGN